MWRVGDIVRFAVVQSPIIGKVTSRIPATREVNIMDDRGRMYRRSMDHCSPWPFVMSYAEATK